MPTFKTVRAINFTKPGEAENIVPAGKNIDISEETAKPLLEKGSIVAIDNSAPAFTEGDQPTDEDLDV